MTRSLRLKLASFGGIGVLAATALIAATPAGTRAAVTPARDVALACSNTECEDKDRWSCCVYDQGWKCNTNCWPKPSEQIAGGKSECVVGIAPGDPIPDHIARDLAAAPVEKWPHRSPPGP
ncbi:MAG TPA: hypothetical protein VEA99_07190 [Gemmatimonadaceae bacterium]|nr:hypothetical protein [Gemmatimonadaceae bacterium]